MRYGYGETKIRRITGSLVRRPARGKSARRSTSLAGAAEPSWPPSGAFAPDEAQNLIEVGERRLGVPDLRQAVFRPRRLEACSSVANFPWRAAAFDRARTTCSSRRNGRHCGFLTNQPTAQPGAMSSWASGEKPPRRVNRLVEQFRHNRNLVFHARRRNAGTQRPPSIPRCPLP